MSASGGRRRPGLVANGATREGPQTREAVLRHGDRQPRGLAKHGIGHRHRCQRSELGTWCQSAMKQAAWRT
jgi:hypothetical protein